MEYETRADTEAVDSRIGNGEIHVHNYARDQSRCYTLKLLLKLVCNGAAKQVSAGVAPCNIKCRNLFGNVKTGLKMLLRNQIIAK